MVSTVHMMTGAAVVVVTGDWWLAGVVSCGLHFVEDMIPHWDPSITEMSLRKWLVAASVDFLLGIVLVLIVMKDRLNGWLFLAVFMSILPDILSIIDYFFPTKIGEKYRGWHKRIQNENHGWVGLLSQVMVVGLAIFIIMTNQKI